MRVQMDMTDIAVVPNHVTNETTVPATPALWVELGTIETTKRLDIYNEGFECGFKAAAEDFINGLINLDYFKRPVSTPEVMDFYAIGFEAGYYRKLAELLIF